MIEILKYRHCLRSIIIAFAAIFVLVASPLLVFGNPQWSRFIFILQSNVFPERDGLWSPPEGSDYTGEWRIWYNNGRLKVLRSYERGLRHGISYIYGPDGTLMASGEYYKDSPRKGTFNYISSDDLEYIGVLYEWEDFCFFVVGYKDAIFADGEITGWLLTKENRLQLGFRAIAKNGYLVKVIEKYTIDGIPYTIDENGNVVYLDKPKEEIIPQRSRIIR